MSIYRRLNRKRSIALAAVLGLATVLGWTGGAAQASTAHTLIVGDGSSWSALALVQWQTDVAAFGLQVEFTSNGSAQGRKDFANGSEDFAVSDIGYLGHDPLTGDVDTPCNGSVCREYAYVPIVSGGTSFPYHILDHGKLVTNLRLSGQTLAKIFTNQITNWNDPAITKDNNGRILPSTPIIPVVHSEGSGSTAQFTAYLARQYPADWTKFAGADVSTEYFPRKGSAISQNGSDGVMNFLTSAAANGAIAYDEYSYALANKYPVAKLENAAGYFTLPDQYNVAVALTQAKINMDKSSKDYLLQDLSNVYVYNDSRTYPLSSYSYMIIPTGAKDPRMKTAQRQTIADFLYYTACQGQAEIGPIGYSALPVNLVQATFDQVAKLKVADPAVDLTQRDVSTCNNPTFDAANPNSNRLAAIAPKPPTCDQVGQGPCTGTGAAASAGTGSGGADGAAASAGSSAAAAGAAKIDPETGQAAGGSTTTSDIEGQPQSIPPYRAVGMTKVLGPIAVVELIALIAVPPIMYFYILRRRRSRA